MEEEKKIELKAIYAELRGYLAETPDAKDEDDIFEESVWTQYNKTVNALKEATEKDYSRFCMKPETASMSTSPSISVIAYRSNLSGLISRLHSEYFAENPNPLERVPNTVITQNQRQDQSVHIQMILDVQSKIDEKIPTYPEGSNEKSFLQKLKSSLSAISNVNQLLQTIFKLAKDSGLSVDEVLKAFS